MLMQIAVTQEDIEHGRQEGCYDCPIALAVSRLMPSHMPHKYRVNLTFTHVWWGGDYRSKLPVEAEQFIYEFDERGPDSVQPFTFDLDVPDAVLAGSEARQ